MELNHVALTVGDRERSAAFYAEHFGLTERVHDDEHLLIVGDGRGSLLTLSQGLVPQGLPATNHFGFQVQAPAQVYAARERLLAAGVAETDWQDDPGFVRVQVADPDGYRVELFAIAGSSSSSSGSVSVTQQGSGLPAQSAPTQGIGSEGSSGSQH